MSVYDTNSQRYLRPIPPNGRFSNDDVSQLELFSVVDLDLRNTHPSLISPHTEDTPVNRVQVHTNQRLSEGERLRFLENISYSSVDEVFGHDTNGAVLQHRGNSYYVIPERGERSLGTVKVKRVNLYLDDYDKLRVNFTDSLNHSYRGVKFVSLEDVDLREKNAELASQDKKFVRLSLARPWKPDTWGEDDDEVCFLQVSYIHGF